MKTNRREFIKAMAMGAAACALPGFARGMASKAAINNRPNIVLILADDFGWGDASYNVPGSPLKTPNIDRIGKEGIRFLNAHTPSSVCSPTRYGLLTGRYAWRSYLKKGVLPGYCPPLIEKERMTLASLLKKNGYATGGFGKWHIGLDWTPVEGDPEKWEENWATRDGKQIARISKSIDHGKRFNHGPTALGFDTFFGTPSNCTRVPVFIRDDHIDGKPEHDAKGLMRDFRVKRDKVDDSYVAEAISFMKKCCAETPGKPFFVYLPLNAVHGCTLPPKRFKGKSGLGQKADKVLWANSSVGLILDALDDLDQSNRTLVIFTADNGPIMPPKKHADVYKPAGPYRGYKTNIWDGGTRVPFFARLPGKIKAGSECDHDLCLTDILATFAALVGEELPAGAGEDSFNQLPAILGNAKEPAREMMVTHSYPGVFSIRSRDWKVIFDTKGSGGYSGKLYGADNVHMPISETAHTDPGASGTGQIYRISGDPYEQKDLWDQLPEKAKEYLKILRDYRETGRSY